MNPETLKARFAREDDQAIDSAIDALFKHAHGRKLLWWLLQIGKVGTQPFTGHALSTSFGCGELNVGQRILERMLSVSPEGYVNLMKEMADARRTRDAELERAGKHDEFGDAGDDDSDGTDE